MGWQAAALTISLGDVAPTEFRIFAAGANTTTKGAYLFDEQAARDVMAAYQAHGNDIMLDLEHLSVEDPETSVNFDPDARGWCKLELRNGECWAVHVTWTPDGQSRLSDKRQRYISPVFAFDSKTLRISRILNIAITALPATDHLEPLVAARRQKLALTGEGDTPMTPEQFGLIAEALGMGADANVEDVIATISAMVKKITDAANGTEPLKDAPKEVPPAADAPAAMVAVSQVRTAARVLARLSGKANISDAVAEVEAWRTSHVELEEQRGTLAKEKATIETSERRRLVADLVKLGAENPATAWADDTATKPAEPWASMPIAALRDRVAKLGGKKRPKDGPAPPAGTELAPELTAEQLKICADTGCKPEVFASLRKTNAAIAVRS